MKAMHEAFIEAYAEMPDPKKNAENPAFRRDGQPMRYADLEAFLDVAKPILTACGFALIQQPVSEGDRVGVHTRLLYTSGEEMDFGAFTVALTKPDPQGAGAAITYCRRYAVSSIFGLAQEDDDANRASSTPQAPPVATKTAGKASEGQVKAIHAIAKELGWSREYLHATLKKNYDVERVDDLTGGRDGQASKVIEYLKSKTANEAGPGDEDIPF